MNHNRRAVIGFFSNTVSDPLHTPLWAGMQEAAEKYDINLICFAGRQLQSPHGFEAQGNILYDLVHEHSLDGLVIWTSVLSHFVSKEITANFCRRYHSLPVVCLDYKNPGITSVRADDKTGREAIINHLFADHGYRRVALLNGPEKMNRSRQWLQTYSEALTRHQVTFDPMLIVAGDVAWPTGRQAGRDAVTTLLDRRQIDIEAIVAITDNMALGVLEALQTRGLRVPYDVAVVGFDDIEESRFATPSLTTSSGNMIGRGRQAIELLLGQFQGQPMPDQVYVSRQLIIRQSCGCFSESVQLAATHDFSVQLDQPNWSAMLPQLKNQMDTIQSGVLASLPQGWLSDLLDSLFEAINDDKPQKFLQPLDICLQKTVGIDQDLAPWHTVLSIVRRCLWPTIHEAGALARAENIWQQARVLVSEAALRQQAYQHHKIVQHTGKLQHLFQQLGSLFNLAEIMDLLSHTLPQLGARQGYLALYEDPASPAVSARLMMAFNDQGKISLPAGGQLFVTSQFVPGDLLPTNKRFHLIIEPLFFRENSLGFLALDIDQPRDVICETLGEHISTVLHGALLMGRVQDHAEDLEAKIVARSAALQREIAERKRTETALQRSEATTRALLAAVPDLIFRVTGEGYNLDVLPSNSVVSVVDVNKVIGKYVVDLLPPDLARRRMGLIELALQTGQVQTDEYQIEIGNSTRIEEARIVPCGTDEVLVIIRDITERSLATEQLKTYSVRLEEMVEDRTQELRDIQERLIRQEKLAFLGQLAGGVGHELRNPLGVITNAIYYLQLVLTESDESVQSYLDLIANRVQEADKIVSDLLSLSRNRIAERSEVTVYQLVDEVLARHPAPEGMTAIVDLSPGLPSLFVDPQQILQVLANLVTNAYQAMSQGGQLDISAQATRTQVKLSVSDTGTGMSAETKEKIFEPLFTTKAKGIGLGLAISRNLVEVNGGNIVVESLEGQGSTFIITLPSVLEL